MESSRRWWIRPTLGMLLGLVVVALVVSAARGRASVGPIEPSATPPSVARTVGPAQVELVDEPAPRPSATMSVPMPEGPKATPKPTPKSTPKPAPRERAENRNSDSEPRPRRTREPVRPTPTALPTPTRTCTPGERPPTGKLGWLGNLRDDRIDESSGLTMSRKHADLAYTMNDEGTSPLIFAVQPSTGRTVSAFDLRGAGEFKDPEAIRLDRRGRLWLADTGDGHPGKPGKKHDRPSREHVTIAVFDEPQRGTSSSVAARRFTVVFSNGPHNAEALAIHPRTGDAFLISNDRVGRVFKLPNPLHAGRNVARATNHLMPAFVTDATFTGNGRFVLVRTMQKSHVVVFDAKTWRRVGTLEAPRMPKGESITVEPNGQTVLLGSEGRHAPLVRVGLRRFAATVTAGASPCRR